MSSPSTTPECAREREREADLAASDTRRRRDALSLEMAWLRSFLAVANTGGLTAAAHALQLSPSQVAGDIEALERALGAVLFDRRTQPVRTTAAAEVFRAHAVTALLELQRGVDAAGEGRDGAGSRLRVGACPGVSSSYVRSVMRELNAAQPNLVVELVMADPAGLTEMIVGGAIDVALRPLLPMPLGSALCHRVIWREEIVAVLREDDPLAELDSLPVHELLSRALIGGIGGIEEARVGGEKEASGEFDLRALLGVAGAGAEITHLADQPRTLVALVRYGFGIGVVGRLALENIDTTGLAVRTIDSPTAFRDMAAFWAGRRTENVGISAFLDAQMRAGLPAMCEPPTGG